jgi:nitrogen fixation protein FixH
MIMRSLYPTDTNPLTGWHMLAIVLAFFSVIIGVNIVMAFAATSTFPGLVVENSYVSSQNYNELLAAARKQDAAGWRHELSADRGVLKFRLATSVGTPASDLSVVAHIGRPSTTRADRDLTLIHNGNAYQAGEALPAGYWEIDVEARRGADIVFRRTQEIFVLPPETVK